MNVLLTGSSGWLGRFLAPALRAAGHRVTGLDVAPGADTAVPGSVADRALVDQVFADHAIEAVVHCGGLHKPDIVRHPASTFVDVNVTGTLNLLEAAVAAGHDRFVFTSTTSLMISAAVRAGSTGNAGAAWWLDEDFGPLRPRNIYGVTKLAAEQLCRLYAEQHGIAVATLRTGRFFPEDDDTETTPSGPNLKANEFLNRRLTVEDAAAAHVAALDGVAALGGAHTWIVSAPTPFRRDDAAALAHDARGVVARCFPDAADVYAARGWVLPERIERVYDAGRIERDLGFRPRTGFAEVLAALRDDAPLPFQHDPAYVSPAAS